MQSDFDYPRRVVVDDTDPRISYQGGSWQQDVGTFDDLGGWGAPYNHTSHGTTQNGASFTFTFEGEFIQVRGIKDNRQMNPNMEGSDNVTALAKWTCEVDGGQMLPISYWTNANAITDRVLCEQGRLSRNQHTLTVNVIIDNPSTQMFWVDRIEYTPLPDANIDNTILKIDGSDPSIRFDNATGAWRAVGALGNGTAQTGSSLSFKFNGTAASLYGFNEGSSQDWQASSGRYYIDNSGDTTFDVEGSRRDPRSGNRTDFQNVLHFTTPNLKPGPHEMVLTYTGTQTGSDPLQWLTIDYLYVTTGESTRLNSSETTMDTLPTRGSDSNSSGSSSSKTPVGAIVGGVVGGIGGLALLVLAAFFFLKWRKAKKDTEAQQFTGVTPSFYSGKPQGPVAPVFTHSGVDYSSSVRSPPAAGSDYDPFNSSAYDEPSRGSFYAASSSVGGSNAMSSAGSAPITNPQPSQSIADLKNAQREAVSQQVVERRHQDSGVRYPQQQQVVVDVPPNYTEQ